jgi:predicted transcriptional regulator
MQNVTGSASPNQDDVARFVERFALMMTEAGLPRMPARVFGALLAADTGKRTASQLAESLQVSPAAISGAVRYLAQVRLVLRARDPGERRDHYELFDDLWYEMYANRDKQFAEWATIMNEGAEALGEHTPAGARLATSAQFFEFLRGEIPKLMQHWREFQKEHGLTPPTR